MKAPRAGASSSLPSRTRTKDEMIGIARGFYDMGIELLATSGTCKALNEAGIPARWVARVSEAHPNILDNDRLRYRGSGHQYPHPRPPPRPDGFKIRRSTVEHSVACITAIDTARAMLTVRTRAGPLSCAPSTSLKSEGRKPPCVCTAFALISGSACWWPIWCPLGTGAAASALSAATYDGYAEVHSAAPGQAGSPCRARGSPGTGIAELLELDTFTVLSQGIAYRNEGAGYFEGSYLYNLALPSGERVAARIHTESVQDGRTSHPAGCPPGGPGDLGRPGGGPRLPGADHLRLSPGPHRLLRGHGRRSGTLQSGGADGKSCYSGSIGLPFWSASHCSMPWAPAAGFSRFLSLVREGKAGGIRPGQPGTFSSPFV